MKFLLVDRNSTMRSIVRHELIDMGYKNIYQVGNAESALLTLSKQSTDVIITELELPGMTGLEFIQTVRKQHELSAVKIFVVAASLSREDLVRAMQSGADGCLVKPFSPNSFVQHLNQIIQKK
jgi:two-component system chemotaxis response regulator CheY